MKLEEMDNPEIILNLWFVYGDNDLIYSLRARAYFGTGTDEEKQVLLQRFRNTDYLIAQAFPIPERFYTPIVRPPGEPIRIPEKKIPVANGKAFKELGDYAVLFDDAIKELEKQMPAQTELSISQHPILCITPLFGDENDSIFPKYC
ncbi:MAG: hypothetical protein ABSG32_18515 [Terriglobia bacterium]|jgi:hypothetical protein